MTEITIMLALLITVPIGVVVYRVHRKVGDPAPLPLGALVEWATRSVERPYGADTDRIIDELAVLRRVNHPNR